MPFIRFRKLKYGENGEIVSGSASIIDTSYVPGKVESHSRQKTREKLGKVVEIFSEKSGIFLSPTRGLVKYDSEKDEFSNQLTKNELSTSVTNDELIKRVYDEPDVHTIFGDSYLFLEILKSTRMLEILAKSINSKIRYERTLAHILFSLLRDGCKVSCEDFIAKSFLSYCINEIPLSTLKSDTRYFSSMGEDKIKVTFFKNFISLMREKYPKFGVGCFIDSTPLPNDINSPFNALCSHGLSETSVQMRLILVIDDITLYPIWFSIIYLEIFKTLTHLKILSMM